MNEEAKPGLFHTTMMTGGAATGRSWTTRRQNMYGPPPDHEISHFDNIAWHEAPTPSRFHSCEVQSVESYRGNRTMERCACGARRGGALGWRDWVGRNSRRKKARHV